MQILLIDKAHPELEFPTPEMQRATIKICEIQTGQALSLQSMKRILYSLLIIFLVSSIYAQDIPAASSGDIQFYADWASFRGKDNKTIQEIYLMTFSDQFKRGADTLAINIHLNIKNNINQTVADEGWTTYTVVHTDSMNPVKTITDETRKELAPGKYNFFLKLTDPLTDKKGETKFNIEVPDLKDALTSTIKFTTTDEKKSVRPNPSRRYGILNPVLALYYEIYPGNYDAENFIIKYSLTDREQKVIKQLPSATVKNKKTTMAVSHGFNVSTVPSGIYDLKVSINDDKGTQIAAISRPFEVIQYDYPKLNAVISEEDAEEAGRLIKILSPEKYSTYKNLNLQGKAEFLVQFWRDLDPSPGTPENEFLTRVQQRYQYANQNFTWGKEEGWASDRGRVLIQYGNPDEIAAHHAESETAPFEIWYYRKDRNYMFVFADMQSNGHFVLVHSNKEGEINNVYWKNSLIK